MPSSHNFLLYVLDNLSNLRDITYRKMMGEYILYYRGVVIGGVYDDRFLIKPLKSALMLLPDAEMDIPYEGAKKMLRVDDISDRKLLASVVNAIYDELEAKK
ncbi:MAG: TfoX/Sxy family protein [Marinilabiliaceae bacterium]|nr:competence protein TfoX [Bacteroidales bacterium]MCR5697884.1 TfoX/Sxy family protein [Marinilabiliaceae bacterium]